MNTPEPVDSRPIAGLRRPDSTITEGQRPNRTRRIENAIVATSLPLEGFRVLDIGCAEGLNALYMADRAAEVVGIDHRPTVIDSARQSAAAIGKTNIQFEQVDARDVDSMLALGTFDVVTAWGFLHRITDIFSFFELISHLTTRVSLEWRTLVIPGMQRLRLAHHPVTPILDPTNLRLGMNKEKIEGLSAFWEPTMAAVASVGHSFGFTKSKSLGYGKHFWSANKQVIHSLREMVTQSIRHMAHPTIPTARIHALLTESDDTLFDNVVLDNSHLPSWDTTLPINDVGSTNHQKFD